MIIRKMLFFVFVCAIILFANAEPGKKDLGLSDSTAMFWQITDIHWDQEYSEVGDKLSMCHNKSLSGNTNPANTTSNGVYGNYFCDSPFTLVQSALQAMKILYPSPDFILWTGDNAPHTNGSSFEVIFRTTSNVTSEMRTMFNETIPIIPVLGNHDTFPKDDYPASGKEFYDRYLNEGGWNSVIPPGAHKDFLTGGYYAVTISKKLKVLVLNTNLYYRYNKLGTSLKDPAGQFAWLHKSLQEARKSDQKVLLTAHAPPGYWERNAVFAFFNDSYNDAFVSIVTPFSDVILAHIYGHEHTDTFRLIAQPDHPEIAGNVAFMAPSLTPWWPRRMEGGTAINPSLRLYSLASDSVLDYQQFHLNLTQANNDTWRLALAAAADVAEGAAIGGSAACLADGDNCSNGMDLSLWKRYYRAREAFDVPSLSVASMHHVAERLASDETFFTDYVIRNSAGIPHKHCDSACRRMHLCSITYATVDAALRCLNKTSAPSSVSGKSVGVAIACLLVAVLAMGVAIMLRQRRKRNLQWVNEYSGYRPLTTAVDAE